MSVANHVAALLCSHKRHRNLLVYSFFLGRDGPGQAYMTHKCNLLGDRIFGVVQQSGHKALRVVDTSWFSQTPNFYGTDMVWKSDESGRQILEGWNPDHEKTGFKKVVTTNQFQGPPIFEGGAGFDFFLYPAFDSTPIGLGSRDLDYMHGSLMPKKSERDRVRISFHSDEEFGDWVLGYVLPKVSLREVCSKSPSNKLPASG